jgi:hypothetical protein
VPTFPRKLPYAGLVALAILLFGTAIVVTRALFKAARTPVPARQQAAWPQSASAPTRKEAVQSAAQASAVTSPDGVHTVGSVTALACQLLVRPPDIGGFRTLITGESDAIDVAGDGVELAKSLAEAGSDVMLVDWSLDGHGAAESIGVRGGPGMAELLQGKAKFEDVVTRVPASGAHLIAAGGAAIEADALDPDQLNLTLDALDTAYDHIIVVSRNSAARALFEAIQGRFDAGVLVYEGKRRTARAEEPGTFLGFEVTDIELFRLERPLSGQVVQERLARVTKSVPEARSA